MINYSEIKQETSLFKNGFYKLKNIENFDFSSLLEKAKKIDTNSDDQKTGYSTDIYQYLDEETKAHLKKLSSKFLKYKIVKKYLLFPSVLNISVLKTKFNKTSYENPTHAMLWHRDLDDVFSQLKFIIPLHSVNKENGAFSVCSKRIASRDQILIDNKMLNKAENSEDNYRKQDVVRVTDETFKKKFDNFIFEFSGDESDLLIVDTNRCYHKGGLVLSEKLERYMIHIRIGSPTNTFHPNMNLKNKNMFKYVHYILGRFIRMFVKIFFSITNKKINSKQLIL